MLCRHVWGSSVGYFGDIRLSKVGMALFSRMISIGSGIIKRLSRNRAEQVRFNRFLWNSSVTAEEIKNTVLHTVKNSLSGDHVLAIQDTTEINLSRLRSKIVGLGVVGNNESVGLFCHTVMAVDPSDGFILGPTELKTWSRPLEREHIRRRKDRKQIPAEEKEIYRWIECANGSKNILSNYKNITIVGDREFDFYAALHQIIDKKTDILLRAKNKRNVKIGEEQSSLDDFVSRLEVKDSRQVEILAKKLPKRGKQNSGWSTFNKSDSERTYRLAKLEIKFGEMSLLRPNYYYDQNAPESVKFNVIEVIENTSSTTDRLHWRLLTSHKINSIERAWELVDWYRKRWLIEQLFKTAKRGGMQTEDIEITKGDSIEKLVTLMMFASIKIMQLTMARINASIRKANLVFEPDEIKVLETLTSQYEGKTEKQKNPYLTNTLARCTWTIARIGGWKGYKSEGPPGALTITRGLKNFFQIFKGWCIAKNVCTG